MDKVVVTGLGAISPLGLSAQESWQNAVNGVSGVAPITLFDTKDYNICNYASSSELLVISIVKAPNQINKGGCCG